MKLKREDFDRFITADKDVMCESCIDLAVTIGNEKIDSLRANLDIAVKALEFYCDTANAQLDMPYEFTENGEQLFGTNAKEALRLINQVGVPEK